MSLGGGSKKGRVILRRDARATAQFTPERFGTCAWCGCTVPAPKAVNVPCPVCASTEVDWPSPVIPPTPNRTRDEAYVPGAIAFSLLGAVIRGRS